MYALAVTAIMLLTKLNPYGKMEEKKILEIKQSHPKHAPFDNAMLNNNDMVLALFVQCLHNNPKKRLTAKELVHELTRIIETA